MDGVPKQAESNPRSILIGFQQSSSEKSLFNNTLLGLILRNSFRDVGASEFYMFVFLFYIFANLWLFESWQY